jgi:hypothetical protein
MGEAMGSDWPVVVIELEAFLRRQGLSCQRRIDADQQYFGNKLLRYGNTAMAVQVALDRGNWAIEIADVGTDFNEWYDAGLLRGLLFGMSETDMPLEEQIDFVTINWPAIVDSFSFSHLTDTHARLALLGKERVRRLFPGLT